MAAEYLVSLATGQTGDLSFEQESLIQSGTNLDQTFGQENIIPAQEPTHGQESLIDISQFSGDHQSAAFYITTDENFALPAEILVQGEYLYNKQLAKCELKRHGRDMPGYYLSSLGLMINQFIFLLLKAPDGLPTELMTNSTTILHANQLPPTYLYLAD